MFKLLLCMVIPGLCAALLLSIVSFIFYHNFHTWKRKPGSFECGFDSWGVENCFFSIQFFMMIALFLIFDLELIFLFPLLEKLVSLSMLYSSLAYILFIFMILTTLYEWFLGTMEWKI